MDIIQGIAAEMGFQSHALERELEQWQTRTVEQPEFRVHRSQIVRICRALSSARQQLGLGGEAPLGAEPGEVLRTLGRRRRALHALHLMWNFFRHKFMQRLQVDFQGFLLAADDLAWSCYAPFLGTLNNRSDKLKEPPLTFLSMEPAPFAQARRSSFLPPGLSSLDKKLLYASLRRMPVPVIGLPWLQVGHLPDLVLVGHESAHIVADDLGLGTEFGPLVADITEIAEPRQSHWQAWLEETFADVVGFLAGGAGYGFALARALADDVGAIIGERADAGSAYPPRQVRMAIARATAEHLTIDTAFADAWRHTYGPAASPFASDVEPLVAAVLGHGFSRANGAQLTELIEPPDADRVDTYVEMLLEESSPRGTLDIRAAIAGAAIAHAREPTLWSRHSDDGPYARLTKHIVESRYDGYRDDSVADVRDRSLDGADAQLTSENMRREDVSIGHAIAELLASEGSA